MAITQAKGSSLGTPASAGQASGLASLNASSLVVQNPANLNAALSTDGTFAANSDTLIPSQKAVKTYVAANASSLSGIKQYSEAVQALGNVSGATSINLANGGVVTATSTGNTT